MKHLSEEDLILLYYREPGVPQGSLAHLGECDECRGAAESLALTLNSCNELRVPEPVPQFERGVWAQLVPHLETKRRGLSMPRFWIAIPVAAILLIGAFLTGRASRAPQPMIVAGLSSQARERILEISLADHLNRVGILLTEISNSSSIDLVSERSHAHDLVEEGRLMRQALALEGNSATLTFLDDLERFMTEVAHSSDAHELQERIGTGSLLFKVRIIESNLRTQGQRI